MVECIVGEKCDSSDFSRLKKIPGIVVGGIPAGAVTGLYLDPMARALAIGPRGEAPEYEGPGAGGGKPKGSRTRAA